MDKIANMLSSIKNASMVGKKEIEVDFSKECENIAKILKESGFLAGVKVFKLKDKAYKKMSLQLAYNGDTPLLTEAKRISKPGLRVYKGYTDIHKVKSGFGIAVVSTSRGFMTDKEARKRKLGGEIVCHIS